MIPSDFQLLNCVCEVHTYPCIFVEYKVIVCKFYWLQLYSAQNFYDKFKRKLCRTFKHNWKVNNLLVFSYECNNLFSYGTKIYIFISFVWDVPCFKRIQLGNNYLKKYKVTLRTRKWNSDLMKVGVEWFKVWFGTNYIFFLSFLYWQEFKFTRI